MLLAFCITISAFSGILTYFVKNDSKRYFWFIFYVFSAFGVLTKGISAVVIPFCTMFFIGLWKKNLREFFRPEYLLPGLCAFLLIVLPWHVMMYKIHGAEFIREYIIKHHFQRFLGSSEIGRCHSVFYFIPTFLIGFLPWSFSFLFGLPEVLKDKKKQDFIVMNIIGFVFTFLFFSVAKTKLITYILPIYPFAAVICAYIWTEKKVNYSIYLTNGIFFLFGILLLFAGFYLPENLYLAIKPVQIPLACMFLVCSFFIKKQYAFVVYIILITLLSSFMIPRLFNIWYGFGQQDLMKFAGYAKSEGLLLGTYNVWERFSLQYYYGGDVEYFLAGKAYGAKYVNTTKFNNTFNNNLIVIEKRDLKKILITLVISGLTILLTIQLTQFHKAYLEEEKQEITALAQQVSWAVKPILNKGDPKELDKYCSLFMASETKITISSPKGIIAGENLEAPDIMETASISYNKKLKTDILYYSIPLNVNGTRYILSLSTETAGISSIISKFENYIILSIIVVTLLILALAVYFFLKIHIPFNKLQSSAIKIASDDTNTDIFIPDGGILFELSCAINKMAKRLRKQITDMQKLEAFRSEFITNISHEVKTPLTGILSAVEILEEQPESQNPTIMKCLNILSNQSYRLNSLIQDILSLSNIEMRQIKGDKDFKNFNLANSITTSVSICSASKGNIKINTSLENLEYFGNSFLMEQAMTNLIMNAIRYSKSDTIDISLKQKDNLIEIKVRDYGIGIPEEHIPHIFEHFYRVDKARSRKLGGTGLGLAIVKNIVTLHNGSITVESKNGCEFTIKLPN